MKSLPVVDNTQMKGTVSQIFDISPSFYFMIKNGKLFVIVFLTFTLHLIKRFYRHFWSEAVHE